jgi:hypothetical protein
MPKLRVTVSYTEYSTFVAEVTDEELDDLRDDPSNAREWADKQLKTGCHTLTHSDCGEDTEVAFVDTFDGYALYER